MSDKPYNLLGDTLALIRNVGFRALSGSDGCWCSYFTVQHVKVGVSCHKSGHTISVEVDGDPTAVNDAMLHAVADEIQSQLSRLTSDEYASGYTKVINGTPDLKETP